MRRAHSAPVSPILLAYEWPDMERPHLRPSIQDIRDDVTCARTYLTDACADIYGSAAWSQTTWGSACAPSLVLSTAVS